MRWRLRQPTVTFSLLAVAVLGLVSPGFVPSGAVVDRDAADVAGAGSAPSGGAEASDERPEGDLPGWKRVFVEEFDADVALGGWPGPYASRIASYPDGTPDTHGATGGRGRYFPSDVLAVEDGALHKHLHTDGSNTVKVAAVMPVIDGHDHAFDGQTYGRYAVRFRADPLENFKLAWMLWPTTDNWDDGEVDFPEGDLAKTIEGYVHQVWTGRPDLNALAFDTGEPFTRWHTAVIEWTPDRIRMLLDGEQVGSVDDHVPQVPMRWTLQTETALETDPDPSVAGEVEIDWVAVWSYDG